jgi:hypothetical protein
MRNKECLCAFLHVLKTSETLITKKKTIGKFQFEKRKTFIQQKHFLFNEGNYNNFAILKSY